MAEKPGGRLAELGAELGRIRFSYKVENSTSKEYWQDRTSDFERYTAKALEYYEQAFALIRSVDSEESERFLLQISRFRQLAASLAETMRKIEESPSIAGSKDRQQSRWSRGIRDDMASQSEACLRHEKEMNLHFRNFYERQIKDAG